MYIFVCIAVLLRILCGLSMLYFCKDEVNMFFFSVNAAYEQLTSLVVEE